MTHLIPISGGKDSQATAIWFFNNMLNSLSGSDAVTMVFCETGNEAEETYKFLTDFIALAPDRIGFEKLVNRRGETIFTQAERKGRFPSRRRQFCTTELKVEPMIDYILSLKDSVVIYSGRRREESFERSSLPRTHDYFEQYFKEAEILDNGKKKKQKLYRPKDVRKWAEKYDATQTHPVLTWTTQDVFLYISKNGFKRNPLYDMGFRRVGCFPCINCSLQEISRVSDHSPAKIDQIADMEISIGSTFFASGKIPHKFCGNKMKGKDGAIVGIPAIKEVVSYAEAKRHTDGLFIGAACLNPYVICE